MFKVKPPFKLAIAASFLNGPARSAEETLAVMEPAYRGEKICTRENIELALQNMKTVGLLKTETRDGETFYSLTGHGRGKVEKALS